MMNWKINLSIIIFLVALGFGLSPIELGKAVWSGLYPCSAFILGWGIGSLKKAVKTDTPLSDVEGDEK